MKALQDYIFTPISYLLYSLATLLFFWGLFEFMLSLQNDKSDRREQGRKHMIYGVIGLVIMFSVKGIIYFIISMFGIDDLPVDFN